MHKHGIIKKKEMNLYICLRASLEVVQLNYTRVTWFVLKVWSIVTWDSESTLIILFPFYKKTNVKPF